MGQPAKIDPGPVVTGCIDVHRLMAVMSDILSERFDAKITMTARPKDTKEIEL